MLKKIRIGLAWLFWTGITLLLLDFTGSLHAWLGWMAKVQFLPAVLALNAGVVAALVLLTLLFGRVYCSVICPLGVFQDGISWLGTHRKKPAYKYKKELKWLRYGTLVLFIASLLAGGNVLVSILAPYSAYGRMVTNLLQPVYLWGNNLLAAIAQHYNSYAFYTQEVWLKSAWSLGIAAATLIVLVLLAWKGGRTWCNTVCPVGTILGFISRFSMFRPTIDESQCVRCHSCERRCKAQCIEISKERVHIDHSRCVSCFNCLDSCPKGGLRYRFAWRKKADAAVDAKRRAFLVGTTAAVGAAALKGVTAQAQEAAKKVDGGFAQLLPKQAPERSVPVTPPGSKSVKHFYQHCNACQLCIAQCPNQVLRPSGSLEHLMEPEMGFEKGWCRPECTRCSELCPTGSIVRITKEEKTQYHVGTAQVNRELCLTEHDTHCGQCASKCPVGAISMVKAEGHRFSIPSVNAALCSGCGACEYYCPVRPLSAITVNGKYHHEA